MDDDLDDILSSALDEIEDDDDGDDLGAAAKAAATATAQSADASQVMAQENAEAMEENMKKLMEDMQNPEFAKSLEETFKALSAGGEGGAMNPFAQGVGATGDGEADQSVARTLQMLSEAAGGMEGADAGQAEAMGEDLMQKMMQEFEKLGEKDDFNNVVDGMMKQLLSKEVMYTPMSLICERYPEWLADNESKLSKEEYQRYGEQYQFFQKIIAVYDTEPDNYQRLTELMQEMQETGQPPVEIIKDLAPGLEFGADGMPVMPNMGQGVVPPGMPGMDPAQGCSVM